MDLERLEILREALETRQRKEELERAVGRAIRRRNLEFKIYIDILSELREASRRDKVSLDDAARKLLEKEDSTDYEGDRKDHPDH